MAARLRSYEPADLGALYDICLKTGDAGQDATALYAEPTLIGSIYSAPYGVLEPDLTVLAVDELGVAGYIVGAADTRDFAARQEREWWPALREQHKEPALPADSWTPDQQRIHSIHHPSMAPADIVDAYPAHIHMNLLPRLQGAGMGTALLKAWLERAKGAGVRAIHLGASQSNTRGCAFWQSRGFEPLRTVGRTVWFGMRLPE